MTKGEKIKSAREAVGMTQEELGRACSTTKQTIYKYENDIVSNIPLDRLELIAQAVGVSAAYIMGWDKTADTPNEYICDDTSKLSGRALRVGYMYDIAAPRDQKIVDMTLEPYEDQVKIPTPAIAPTPSTHSVVAFPKAKVKRRKDNFDELIVFEEDTAAGLGNYLSDAPATHVEQYPSGMVPAGANYGVQISGDSMMPKFKNGSTAFVQSTPIINTGEIGVFALNGSSYIKQLIVDRKNGTVCLHSLNPSYKDIVVSEGDTLYTLGRVLGSYPE